MGQEIVYCHLCGNRILEKDLLAGRALTLLDKTFCHQCKEKAFQQMSPADEARTEPHQAAGMEPSAAKMPRPAGVQQRVAAAERPPRVVPVRRPRNVLPLYVGGTVGFLALTALLIMLIKKAENQPRPTTTPTTTAAPTPGPDASSADADAAMKELDDHLKTNPAPEEIVRKCDDLAPRLRGTKHERRWLEIRTRADEKRTLSSNEQELHRMIERIKAKIAEDKDYRNYEEISRLIREARDFARSKVPEMEPDVKRDLEEQYVDPYENAAKGWYDQWADTLRTLEQERRWRDAKKILDKFPDKYRYSKVGKQVDTQRKQYERNIGQATTGADTKGWLEFARLAHNDVTNKNFRSARLNYEKALKLLPPAWKDLPRDDKMHAYYIWYNLGCMDAEEAKKAEGDTKADLTAGALKWLETSFKEGLFKTACGCHGKWQVHMLGDGKDVKGDEDLEELVKDDRFKALMKKYASE